MSTPSSPSPTGVSLCASGCVNLHFGRTVVHLRPDEFEGFFGQLLAALPRIDERLRRDGHHSASA